MSRKRTVKLPGAFRMDRIVLPVILGLLYVAGIQNIILVWLEQEERRYVCHTTRKLDSTDGLVYRHGEFLALFHMFQPTPLL